MVSYASIQETFGDEFMSEKFSVYAAHQNFFKPFRNWPGEKCFA